MRQGVVWTPLRAAFVALLMGWSPEKNLTERFAEAVDAARSAKPRWDFGRTYDGWSEALLKWSPLLVPALQKRFRQCMLKFAGRFTHRHGWVAIAVDGTRVEAPRTTDNEKELGCAGKQRTAPQLMLTVLFHMGLGLPWSYRIGPGVESERVHLNQMIQELPPEALLVADAGFISYALCARMMRENRHFLLRVGGNLRLLLTEMEGCQCYRIGDSQHTVLLWPDQQQRRNDPPLKLRLIVIGEGKHAVYLVTNVLDEKRLTFAQAGELYAMRWGEEVFFRSYKQTMDRSTLRSRAPRNCYLELTWNLLATWLLGLLSVRRIRDGGHDPLCWSPAQSRKVIRAALRNRNPHRGHPSLDARLRRSLKDTYKRSGPKATREWARKKKQKPPGPPQLQPLTKEQVQRAQRLKANKTP